MAHYEVYLLENLGLPRNHQCIYVQTTPCTIPNYHPSASTSAPLAPLPQSPSGHIYQVSGNIQIGMTYAHRSSPSPPEQSADFISQSLIGYVTIESYEEGRILEVCNLVPVPQKQFEGVKRLFPKERIRRCQEWTKEVMEMLKEKELLVEVVSQGKIGQN